MIEITDPHPSDPSPYLLKFYCLPLIFFLEFRFQLALGESHRLKGVSYSNELNQFGELILKFETVKVTEYLTFVKIKIEELCTVVINKKDTH
jgi:hypothetical protein